MQSSHVPRSLKTLTHWHIPHDRSERHRTWTRPNTCTRPVSYLMTAFTAYTPRLFRTEPTHGYGRIDPHLLHKHNGIRDLSTHLTTRASSAAKQYILSASTRWTPRVRCCIPYRNYRIHRSATRHRHSGTRSVQRSTPYLALIHIRTLVPNRQTLA